MSESVLIDDATKERVRTLVFDLTVDDLLVAVFDAESYQFHTTYRTSTEVALLTDTGLKSISIYPHDGDTSPRTFDDYFMKPGEAPADPGLQNKSAVTIVLHDDAKLVEETATTITNIAHTATPTHVE